VTSIERGRTAAPLVRAARTAVQAMPKRTDTAEPVRPTPALGATSLLAYGSVWRRPGADLPRVAAALSMQRVLGNNAVARLLRDRSSATLAARVPGAGMPAGPGSGPTIAHAVIQRDIGFEFETPWRVEHADGSPLEKYERIYTGTGANAGFNMEADTASSDLSDIEFVVKPPVAETAGGQAQLGATMAAMQTFFGNLITAAGGHTIQGAPIHPFVNDDKQNLVIKPGTDNAAVPQTTVGVRLDRLIALLTELSRAGGDAKSELLGLAGRQDFSAGQLTRFKDTVAGTATTWSLHDNNRPDYHSSEQMKGFVALILQYLLRGATVPGADPYAQAFKYAKMVSIIMARTDFGGMFKMLPRAEQDYYAGHPDHWVQMVLDAANLSPNGNVIERGLKGDPPVYKGGKLKKAGKVIPIPITRKDWLQAMLLGHDLLTVSAFEAFKPGQEAPFSGAFGALGKRTDDVGPGLLDKGAIIELREIKEGLDYQDWAQFADDVFTYIMALNNWNPGGGAAPQYTKTATPGRGMRR
jgi:hypothetical protein